MTGQIELWLPFTRLTLSYEEIWVSPKMSVLPSETVPNSGLSPRQVDRVVNKTRRRRCAVVCYYFLNLGRSSRGGRQKLILDIIALMVSHPSGSHQQSSRAAG